MAVDINRIVLAAAEAALKQDAPAKNKGLSTGRALAAGATLVVVGRVAAGPGGRFVRDKIQERLSNDSETEDAQDEELEAEVDEEPEAEFDEEPEAEVAEDEEPGAEVDEEEPEAGVDDEDEPEAEVDEEEEPEAEVDEEEEPEAEVDEDEEPEAEVDEDEEPEAEVDEDEEPEAEVDEDEPDAEVDEETGLEEDGERGNGARRPRHHPLFEQALAGKGAQRRRSPQPPKGRKPTGRPRIAPPRRPTRPSTNGG